MNIIDLRDSLPHNPALPEWQPRERTTHLVVHHSATPASTTPEEEGDGGDSSATPAAGS